MPTYIRRWPIEDQDKTQDELIGEAIPDLTEALEAAGLRATTSPTRWTVVFGAIPHLEARVSVYPAEAPGVVQLRSDDEFDRWHAAQYHSRHREAA